MANTEATRRGFVVGTGAVAASLALTGVPQTAAAATDTETTARKGRKVAVLGAGVAGLTAAHELAERGYSVTVYDRRAIGGKARSINVPDSAKGGRKPLPGEHGFRLVPGFYHNLPDTMRRIPFGDNPNGVWDNLVMPTESLMARTGKTETAQKTVWRGHNPNPLTVEDIRKALTAGYGANPSLPANEVEHFVNRMLVFMTSCDERREQQWEYTPWWDFTGAVNLSEDYKFFLAIGITRSIVVAKAEVASTRTVATMLETSFFNALGRGADGPNHRFLTLPTNEALFDPWVTYLKSLGVRFRIGWDVQDVVYEDGHVSKIVMKAPDGDRRHVVADHYIQAMPAQHARRTWGKALRAADPQLNRVDNLVTDWMTGIQFFLTERPAVPHGLINCLDSPWSITALAQSEFWPSRDFAADYGDGIATECLSVDISEWNTPGILYGKTAKECTPAEVAKEVWAQLKAALNDDGNQLLKDNTLHRWHLDPGVQGIGTPNPVNEDAMLFHPVGTLHNRPTAKTQIPNFYLAGDYVRVPVELASMEGANSSARLAVNALLDNTGSKAPRCTVTPLHCEPALEELKKEDQIRYQNGLANALDA